MIHVLIVEPDARFRLELYRTISDLAEVRCVSTFAEARFALLDGPPDLLVANLRLGAYNGLHLIHLAGAVAPRTRSVVYTEQLDVEFGREVQRVGALYDTRRSFSIRWQAMWAPPFHHGIGAVLAFTSAGKRFEVGVGLLIVRDLTD